MQIYSNTFPSFYRKVSPYLEVIHSIGLLHTCRQKDAAFAFSLLESAFKQKNGDFFALISHETTLDRKDAFVYKMYRKGNRDFFGPKEELLGWFKTEYNAEKLCTHGSTKLSKKTSVKDRKRFNVVVNKLLSSACKAGYKYVLYYDISKEEYAMWMDCRK